MIPKIIWLTGLSGAGKTTLSKCIYNKLKKKYKIRQIDGDTFRKKNNNLKSFTKKNIILNNKKIINHVKKIKNCDFVIVSVISPLLITRMFAKKIFDKNYYEVFIFCKLTTLKNRDTKGLYKKAELGILKKLIGYNSNIKYEKSNYKTLEIDTDKYNLKQSTNKILKKIGVYES